MSDQRYRVEVDHDLCVGSGVCVGTAPAYFALTDGLSRPVRDVVEADDQVIGAAESCPMEAILVRDEASGEILAPAD